MIMNAHEYTRYRVDEMVVAGFEEEWPVLQRSWR